MTDSPQAGDRCLMETVAKDVPRDTTRDVPGDVPRDEAGGGPGLAAGALSECGRLRLPRHIGFIPDGNRRWASERGLAPEHGYAHGIAPGLDLIRLCRGLGVDEVSIYGFTQDNTRRAAAQTRCFQDACVAFALAVVNEGVALLVVGDDTSKLFPAALKPFRTRQGDGMKVNLLVNYGWSWDLGGLRTGRARSDAVSRIDLIVRWGGCRRLSGFLPVQSVYADFYVVDALWPDFEAAHLGAALRWFHMQDRTLGG